MKETRSYLKWDPIIKPEEVYEEIISISGIIAVDQTIFWLESRPAEQGRVTIIKKEKNGTETEVIPKGYNVRTRVHEYGGMPYTANKEYLFFTNFEDQRLYCQNLLNLEEIKSLTPEKNQDGSVGKYAALKLTPNNKGLIFVYEKEFENKENENFLACIDLDLAMKENLEPKILHQGYDFYGEPCISPDGFKIAWLSWNHPNMPWNSTTLWVGNLDGVHLDDPKQIVNNPNSAICFPKFSNQNQLFFILDFAGKSENDCKNWWNFYCYTSENEEINDITQDQKEFGQPMWSLGSTNYVFISDEELISIYKQKGNMFLSQINIKSGEMLTLDLDLTYYSSLAYSSKEERLYFIGANPATPMTIYSLNLDIIQLKPIKSSQLVPSVINEKNLSIPKFIEISSDNTLKSYSFYYPPRNDNFTAPEKEKPPLIVFIHGGPTGNTFTNFSRTIQFWTSSGFAILDIDYQGSTGYGRKYRDSLKGFWGVTDISDVINSVNYLIKKNLVSDKIAISGGSAGGYAVQRVLTMFPDLFKVGASYFGIGNLLTLVKLTHKFESRYIDWLVGADVHEGKDIYNERSPINHLDKLKSPMILLQGLEDKIVTPEVSREMVEILEKKGIKNEYVEYKGEGHGFRIKENKIDALKREAQFFRDVLSN